MRTHTAIVLGLLFVVPARGQVPTAEQKQATLAYLQSLRKENGYAPDAKPGSPVTLPGMSSALRAIKYFGGEVKDKDALKAFAGQCIDPKTGGIAPTPGGKPDVRSTAVGVMAMVELGMPLSDPLMENVSRFLSENAKTFEDIRIAAAAFEALKLKAPKAEAWLAEIAKMKNPDGTYGKGGNLARDTGSVAACILRLGGKLDNPEAVVKAIRSGQRPDGGWGRDGEQSSDMETTYRVMRALYMMKAKPDLAACQAFVAKCRNADGSYSVQPGQPGSVGATYFAGIVLKWTEELK
jgi:prenyltransferase beta subunit